MHSHPYLPFFWVLLVLSRKGWVSWEMGRLVSPLNQLSKSSQIIMIIFWRSYQDGGNETLWGREKIDLLCLINSPWLIHQFLISHKIWGSILLNTRCKYEEEQTKKSSQKLIFSSWFHYHISLLRIETCSNEFCFSLKFCFNGSFLGQIFHKFCFHGSF